ncbi:MAG: hypothetical protein NUV51_03820 [Sulfuricaulis sp.]|nr:hypothetical protein [Sulfuricaulis sp.]
MTISANIPQLRDGGGIDLAFDSSASTASATLPTGTTFARLLATTDCYIEVGGGTAAAAGTGAYLAAFRPEFFAVEAGTTVRARAVSGSGLLNIKPCAG